MRAEASAEHRKALSAARQTLTAEHHRSQERLRGQVEKREAEAARRVEEIEAAAYAERQKIKADLEGLRWREIAARLPGRTESGCRNRWVRTQEPQLAAAGMPVRGAAEVFAALRAASLMPAKRQRVDTGARAHNPPPVTADVAARPPSAYV